MLAAALAALPLIEQVGGGILSTITQDLGGLFSLGQSLVQGQNVPGQAGSAPAGSTTAATPPSLAAAVTGLSNDMMGVLIGLQSTSTALANLNPSSAATGLIQAADANGDGALSQSEFEQAFQGLQSLLGGQHHPPGAGSSTQADRIFSSADTNGDGQLSQTELANYLTAAQQAAVARYQKVDQLVSGFATQLAAVLNGPTTVAPGSTTGAVTG